MIRSRATLLATTIALAAIVSGGIAAANADTGASGASGPSGASGASGTTGTTGTSGATGATATAATIIVNGAGFATIDSSAPVATVQSAYLGALESAMTDAHTKAEALTGMVGDTLDAVQNITEQSSDSDGCTGPGFFGASHAATRPPVKVAPSGKGHGHGKTHKPTARLADASSSTCTLEADVTVTYGMSAS